MYFWPRHMVPTRCGLTTRVHSSHPGHTCFQRTETPVCGVGRAREVMPHFRNALLLSPIKDNVLEGAVIEGNWYLDTAYMQGYCTRLSIQTQALTCEKQLLKCGSDLDLSPVQKGHPHVFQGQEQINKSQTLATVKHIKIYLKFNSYIYEMRCVNIHKTSKTPVKENKQQNQETD